MKRLCPIAVDIMGGDNAPHAVIQGSIDALREWSDIELHLVGPSPLITKHTKELDPVLRERIRVIDASESISMEESPVRALRKKRDSSIAIAAKALQDKAVEGLFSAGPTGATIAAACFSTQMLGGVKRPGIAVTFPGMKGPVVLCDVGANVSCRPEHLLQYAVMATEYCRAIHHVEAPKVALLTIGSEEGKGNRLTQDSHHLLKQASTIHYSGLIEGHEVLTGKADVVVCDGFTGNIVLKSSEGVGSLFLKRFREALSFLSDQDQKKVMENFAHWTDYSSHGGALLLGVSGCVIIGHGRSGKRAIRNGIGVAREFARLAINARIVESLRTINNKG